MYLRSFRRRCGTGSYRPQPVRRVEIPKGDGRTRPLGIPAVKDRIVQTAVKLVIEPIFEAKFQSMSYGFRPGRGCQDALREVDQLIKEGYTFVVDADLESYFDTIPHERLMQRVEERISDGRVLGLLRAGSSQDIMQGMERWTPTAGTPQGAVISPLLANIYLHPLDELMASCGYRMVRYADDFVVLCQSREEAQPPWREIRALDRGQRAASASGQNACRRLPATGAKGSSSSATGLKLDGVGCARRASTASKTASGPRPSGRAATASRASSPSLNRMLTGLVRLLQARASATPSALDGFIRRRLRAILRKQAKRPGFGKLLNDHHPMAQCILRGSRAARTGNGLAERETLPMRKPPTGEPYAGKPHVRFGGRGGTTPSLPL